MRKSALFKPIRIRDLELANRIVIAPMCQYSAVDGCMTDWHLIHLGQLALSGAALLTIEATAVLPEGRITYADVGLWSDETETAIARTVESIRPTPIFLLRYSWRTPGGRLRPNCPGEAARRFLLGLRTAGKHTRLHPLHSRK